jgi:hypothetical protein
MVVAVAFSCIRPQGIAVSGIVFCPRRKSGPLLSGLHACAVKPLHRWSVKKWGTGRDWVEQHFNFVDTSSSTVEFAPLALRRYFAFARVDNILVRGQGLGIGFDVFVGPGERALPRDDGDEPDTPSRAIHGFANVTHDSVFNHEIAQGEGYSMPGNAALCLVENPDDLLGDGWGIRRDGVFEVVPQNEVRAVLLIEPTAHWSKSSMGLHSDAVVGHEVRDPLKRGFVFRARLIVELPVVGNQQVVGL